MKKEIREPIEKELNEVGHCYSAYENNFDELYGKCLEEVSQNEFNKRADIEDLDDIEQTVTSFLNEIKNKYDDILKKFIREYELD